MTLRTRSRKQWMPGIGFLAVSGALILLGSSSSSHADVLLSIGLSGVSQGVYLLGTSLNNAVQVTVQLALCAVFAGVVIIAGFWFVLPLAWSLLNLIQIAAAKRLRSRVVHDSADGRR